MVIHSAITQMSQRELDELYRSCAAGEVPNGSGAGTALVFPGTSLARPCSTYLRLTAWQGKTFDRERGRLYNRVTPFGIHAAEAKVYKGRSLFDGRESIILDYSRTSAVARFVRDEIREVSVGVYLGFAYAFGIRWISFALVFD